MTFPTASVCAGRPTTKKLRQALRENEEYIKVQVLVPEGDKVSETCAGGTTAEIEGASVRFDAEVVSSLKKGA